MGLGRVLDEVAWTGLGRWAQAGIAPTYFAAIAAEYSLCPPAPSVCNRPRWRQVRRKAGAAGGVAAIWVLLLAPAARFCAAKWWTGGSQLGSGVEVTLT